MSKPVPTKPILDVNASPGKPLPESNLVVFPSFQHRLTNTLSAAAQISLEKSYQDMYELFLLKVRIYLDL